MMEVIFEEDFFQKFRKIVKLQNILLLSIIAKDNGWDLKELKRKYLKERIKKSPREDDKVKITIKNEKKTLKKSPNTEAYIQKQLELKDIENKEDTTNINGTYIKCQKYSFMDKIYYVSSKNYVYDKDGNFIGIMEGDEINFDGEESEDNI